MTRSMIPAKTSRLVALVAALALLLAAPLGIAALEANAITGPAMRSFESTSVGQIVGSLSADAQAAISRTQQADKAAGQASFFCFAWQCRDRHRTLAYYSGSTLRTLWRLNYPKNIFGHPKCRTWVNMAISVTNSGAVRSSLVNCR